MNKTGIWLDWDELTSEIYSEETGHYVKSVPLETMLGLLNAQEQTDYNTLNVFDVNIQVEGLGAKSVYTGEDAYVKPDITIFISEERFIELQKQLFDRGYK